MHTPRKSALVSSPYFNSTPPPFRHISTEEKHSSSSELDSDGTESDTELCKNPLFCYYFRNFFLAYQRLSLLKPILIQESVAHDPWKLLVAVTLLNKTSGKLAVPVFQDIIAKWSTPYALSHADPTELTATLNPLGTQNVRSARLIKLSATYLRDPPNLPDLRPSTPRIKPFKSPSSRSPRRQRYPPTPISHLPGTGPYALDSYRIFCTVQHDSLSTEWKSVMPSDKELIRYLRWKWAFVERQEWSPTIGVIRPATVLYLNNLISELESFSA